MLRETYTEITNNNVPPPESPEARYRRIVHGLDLRSEREQELSAIINKIFTEFGDNPIEPLYKPVEPLMESDASYAASRREEFIALHEKYIKLRENFKQEILPNLKAKLIQDLRAIDSIKNCDIENLVRALPNYPKRFEDEPSVDITKIIDFEKIEVLNKFFAENGIKTQTKQLILSSLALFYSKVRRQQQTILLFLQELTNFIKYQKNRIAVDKFNLEQFKKKTETEFKQTEIGEMTSELFPRLTEYLTIKKFVLEQVVSAVLQQEKISDYENLKSFPSIVPQLEKEAEYENLQSKSKPNLYIYRYRLDQLYELVTNFDLNENIFQDESIIKTFVLPMLPDLKAKYIKSISEDLEKIIAEIKSLNQNDLLNLFNGDLLQEEASKKRQEIEEVQNLQTEKFLKELAQSHNQYTLSDFVSYCAKAIHQKIDEYDFPKEVKVCSHLVFPTSFFVEPRFLRQSEQTEEPNSGLVEGLVKSCRGWIVGFGKNNDLLLSNLDKPIQEMTLRLTAPYSYQNRSRKTLRENHRIAGYDRGHFVHETRKTIEIIESELFELEKDRGEKLENLLNFFYNQRIVINFTDNQFMISNDTEYEMHSDGNPDTQKLIGDRAAIEGMLYEMQDEIAEFCKISNEKFKIDTIKDDIPTILSKLYMIKVLLITKLDIFKEKKSDKFLKSKDAIQQSEHRRGKIDELIKTLNEKTKYLEDVNKNPDKHFTSDLIAFRDLLLYLEIPQIKQKILPNLQKQGNSSNSSSICTSISSLVKFLNGKVESLGID